MNISMEKFKLEKNDPRLVATFPFTLSPEDRITILPLNPHPVRPFPSRKRIIQHHHLVTTVFHTRTKPAVFKNDPAGRALRRHTLFRDG